MRKFQYGEVVKRLTESRVVTPDHKTGNVIILMGASGSGKSAVTRLGLINLRGLKNMSSDLWTELAAKRAGEDLGDPEITQKYHLAHSDSYKDFSMGSIGRSRDQNFIVEVTGNSLSSLQDRISKIRGYGNYRVVLVHVRVPLDVALSGNGKRQRKVPEEVLRSSFANAEKNFTAIMEQVDEAWIISNWTGSRYPSFKDMRSSNFIDRVK